MELSVKIGKKTVKKAAKWIIPGLALCLALHSGFYSACEACDGSIWMAFVKEWRNDDNHPQCSPKDDHLPELLMARCSRRDGIEKSAGLQGKTANGSRGVEFRPSDLPFLPWSVVDEGQLFTFIKMDHPNDAIGCKKSPDPPGLFHWILNHFLK
jgi:hypothetical protein